MNLQPWTCEHDPEWVEHKHLGEFGDYANPNICIHCNVPIERNTDGTWKQIRSVGRITGLDRKPDLRV